MKQSGAVLLLLLVMGIGCGMVPSELAEKIKLETKRGTNDSVCTSCARNGSDGDRALTCIKLVVVFLPRHIAKNQLSIGLNRIPNHRHTLSILSNVTNAAGVMTLIP